MQLAQPPGVRSCFKDVGKSIAGEGGEWEYCRNQNGSTSFFDECRDLTGWMCTIDRNAFLAELADLLDRATKGRLVRGNGSLADVSKMESAEVVLEIRVRQKPRNAKREKQHVRIYFTEPAHETGVLLMLHIASKRPDKMGVKEQNGHIMTAQRRADAHFRRG